MRGIDPPIMLQKLEIIDLPAIAALEERSYPNDEVASRKVMDYRINYANHLCYAAIYQENQQLIGFVVATGAPDDTTRMSNDMLRNHYQGNVLCIHSVVIDHDFRGKGYGSFMLKSYLNKIRTHTNMKRALLLCKRHLVPFYEGAGFRQLGLSSITLGKDPWIEMECDL